MARFGLKIPVLKDSEKTHFWKWPVLKTIQFWKCVDRSEKIYFCVWPHNIEMMVKITWEKLRQKACFRTYDFVKNYAWRIFFVIGSSKIVEILSSKFTFWEFLRKLEFLSLIQLVPKWLFSCGDYSGIILVELQWVIFVKVPQSRRGWWLRLN